MFICGSRLLNLRMGLNKMKIKFVLLFAISICTVNAYAQWHKESAGIMGTNIYTEIWHEDPAVGEMAIQAVMNEMERINQLMSPYIDTSELSKINREAGKGEVHISEEMFTLLSLAHQVSNLTDGAFDITYASVGYLYNYRSGELPAAHVIAPLLKAIDYRHVVLDHTQQTVRFKHPNVKIDLGGIAKGYAVDNAIALIEGLGVKHGLVTAGGDTRLLGDKTGTPWTVGITDPRNKGEQAVLIPLENTAMSTSGDYERYFEQDGVRYHHILSPQTGESAREVQSVSIIGPKSVYNDALSTAVFVMGVEKGMGFINSLPDFEAIIMDNERKLHYSTGLLR